MILMRKFEYKEPRVHSGELRTPVVFYKHKDKSGPFPGESEKEKLYNAWAKVDEVWLKDLEVAKSNGTLTDVTRTIRDPQSDYIPSNKHFLEIDAPQYAGKQYNIKHVQPDLKKREFIAIVAELKS